MSLDLYLKTKNPMKQMHTGIYVRRKGKTCELTKEEAQEQYPGQVIEEYEEESDELWRGNCTHNLCKMAMNVKCGKYNLYQLLWHPNENGFYKVTEPYRHLVGQGLLFMICDRRMLEQFNPENGWGSYDTLLSFMQDYCKALSKWDGEEEIRIETWI